MWTSRGTLRRRSPLSRCAQALLCVAAQARVAAGCGGDDDGGGSSADLTEFAPADAPLFVEGAIKPEGDLKSSLEAILERFPEGDTVGTKLIDELNASAKEDGSDAQTDGDNISGRAEYASFREGRGDLLLSAYADVGAILTESSGFQAAEEAVGDGADLAFLVEMEPIVDLVESTGEDDADFQEAKPYLEAFDLSAAGGQVDGDTTTQRFVVRFSD